MTADIEIPELVPLMEGGSFYGWRVKTTRTHHIDVLEKLVNWRLVTTAITCPLIYDRYWCYSVAPDGTKHQAMLNAIAAAVLWDGADGTEPMGWNKNGQTQEWRPPVAEAELTAG